MQIYFYTTISDGAGLRCVQCTDRNGAEKELTSKFFIIATGGRPKYPSIPGAKEFGISRSACFGCCCVCRLMASSYC